MASVTDISRPSFGLPGVFDRTKGVENPHIFEIVSRLRPKTLAASRQHNWVVRLHGASSPLLRELALETKVGDYVIAYALPMES